jgi:phosphatidylethanolamine/phosphatidyl-N-methylethanolamine N-methyltransferase
MVGWMHEQRTSQQYDAWARIYDYTFGSLVRRRQRRAVAELHLEPGRRVLDMGVGTGLTLPHYPEGVEVVGIDLTEGMLRKAEPRLPQCRCRVHLVQGDALRCPFGADSFDHILITHVISVVSDPPGLLAEAQRLVKPGGRIVILNHFQSNNPVVAALESLANPLCVRVGWRSDLGLAEVVDRSPLRLLYQFKLAWMDLWQIVVMQKPA